MKLILRFILCLSLLGTTSCGHSPITGEKPSPHLEIRDDKLDRTQSFGFVMGQDEYDFAQVDVKNQQGRVCRFFAGFKNGNLSYSFPADRLRVLGQIYFRKLSIEDKKKQALAAIDSFEKENRVCTAEIAERQTTASEMIEGGLYFVLFLPLALLASVTFAGEDTVRLIQDTMLQDRMDQLRLGVSLQEVEKLLKRPLAENKLPTYTYYSVDGKGTRLAMFFKEGRLNAFVRGYQYSTPHEGVESK